MGLERRAFLVTIAALPLLACASNDRVHDSRLEPEAPTSGSATPALEPAIYVGTVEKNDMRVGLVVENGKAALFFCGGPDTLRATRWFRGAVSEDSISLDKDGAQARGAFDAETASGTMTPKDGEPLKWKVSRIAEGSVAGLYEAKDEGIAGVVVTSEDFAQGAYIGPAPKLDVFQIIVIRPIKVLDVSLSVSITLATASREIVVKRVRPQ